MNYSDLFHAGKGEDNKHAYKTPLENKVKDFLSPFQEYIKDQVVASITLLICVIAAIIWATLPQISNSYHSFTSVHIGFHIANLSFDKPLSFWSNDILLTIFFFFVGLEIKREFLVGELADRKAASLVICSAIGGALIPGIIYFSLTHNTAFQDGWGIPMATDTAFALGILSCFKKRLPPSVFTFIAALAIIDDIISMIIVAVFYSDHINLVMLALAFSSIILLTILNYSGFRKALPYLVVGLITWITIENSGIHGTISGVLIAFAIPARPEKGPNYFTSKINSLLQSFEKRKADTPLILEDEKQHSVLEEIQEEAQKATTPLQRWTNKLKLPVSLLILPLFTIANAGIQVSTDLFHNITGNPAAIGIIFGLILGKPLGVLMLAQLSLYFKLSKMPDGASIKQLLGACMLTGVGFTMSLFIANLSFSSLAILSTLKGAILLGSLIAGLIGVLLILATTSKESSPPPR